jgi:hypothetical protein
VFVRAKLLRTQDKLSTAEKAKNALEQYSRHLEQTLEKSGKGVALLKAARLQEELDFVRKQAATATSSLIQKVQTVQFKASEHRAV